MSEQDVRDADSCLTSQCLAFCQTLASKGQAIKFSLKIGTHFSFSLDTKMENPAPLAKKQKSPSALRRNARRRKEFLASKEAKNTSEESTTKGDQEFILEDFECNQCKRRFKTEPGLNIHIGKAHKTEDVLETMREGENDKSLDLSFYNERGNSFSNSTITEEENREEKPENTDEYPHPQKCCFEQCDLVLHRKSEYAKHIMHHWKEDD